MLTLHDATEYSGINISRIFLLVFLSYHCAYHCLWHLFHDTCLSIDRGFVFHKLSMLLCCEAGEPLVRSLN